MYITAASGNNGVVYVIGDDTGNGTVTGASYAYHPSTNTWDQIASVPLYSSPWGLEGTTAATTAPDGTIYAFSGGWNNSEVSTYNQNSNTWTQIASHLYGAYGQTATAGTDGTVYVMGGYTTNYAAVSEVDAFTPDTAVISVTALPGLVYNGTPQETASYSAIGVNGVVLPSSDFTDTTVHTNACTYNDALTFTDPSGKEMSGNNLKVSGIINLPSLGSLRGKLLCPEQYIEGFASVPVGIVENRPRVPLLNSIEPSIGWSHPLTKKGDACSLPTWQANLVEEPSNT